MEVIKIDKLHNLSGVIDEAFKIDNNMITIRLFGLNIPISESLISMWIVMAILIIGAFILTRNLKTVPGKKQNVVEMMVEFVNNFLKEHTGHYWRSLAPYIGTVLLFLIVSNIIGILNVFPTSEFFYNVLHIEAFKNVPVYNIKPPTKDISITAMLAVMSIVVLIVSTIALKGPKKFLKTFVSPVPFLLPFNILDYIVRPLSLTLRLFGNIIAGFILMEIVKYMLPLFVPAFASIYFDLFDGIIQAYIFVFLTTLYIAENLEEQEV